MKYAFAQTSLLALAASLAAAPVYAQGAAADTAIDEIVVTGTKRADVTALSSATPVDVVSAEALGTNGSPTLVQSLRTQVPSATFSQVGGIIGARLANSVSLRGLPAGNTLVLVNGKRRNPTAKISTGNEWSRGSQPVDLNDLPLEAVARVEVLRDGASAQYGSDAVAGVVNVVLRGNEPGGFVSATYGEFYKGDGVSRDIAGWYTVPLGDSGFLNVTAHLRNSGTTDRDNPDIRTYFFPGDPREALVDKDFGFYGNPNARSAVGSFNSEYDLSENLTVYGFGTAAYRKSITKYMIRPAADNNVRALFPAGRMAQVAYIFRNYDMAGGLKYDAGAAGTFDFSLEYGHGRQSSSMYNSQNATYGLATPDDFFLGNYNQEQFNAQLDYVREIPVGFSKFPLTLSAGVGYREETFSIDAGDLASYADGGVPILDGPNAGRRPSPGAADFAGLQPADAGKYDREIFSAYVGLEQQLTEQFQLGAAARFEDYSDFGSTVTGKLSGRYDFTPAVAVRASVSNGFRAPSMGQIGASQTTSLWIQPPTGPQFLGVSAFYPVTNPVARALGAQDLEPEKSINFSAGLVLRPAPGLSLTVDAYRIELDDVILPVDNLTGAAMTSILARFGVTNVSAVRFFANQADITVKGVDVVARYDWSWDGVGRFGATLGANFNDVGIDTIKPNPPALAGTGLVLVGRVSQGYLTQWAPDSKITAALNYTSGPFAVDFTAVRYGKYKNTVANPANDQVFSAQWVAKLAVSYSFWNQTKITVGADNLFDSYPDRPLPQNRFNGFNNYDLVAPEGGNGGYYYVSLSKRF
ncbi:TonB-dependent receptor [Phenylobacterium sp. SCN 70-31]|uniref:TonB-dependent receptor plug domain-containing protein n=1 Tax=Phenylobacterium sp. SCN 70-31 TaxID=1660129 RepID=UPI00086DF2F9|nr:TonB-dependent receptor [Phenylobacterium sp. SCN 70-31]ODT88617.1 MAG: hypothetical protein ABS78_05490 [Phenylobacterium sp. SCN 70-31]